jgi:hypothetical protein
MNSVRDENGDLITDSRNMLSRWKKYFSEILNVNGTIDCRQTEIHTAKPLVGEPSYFEAEITFKKFERYKSPCIGQITIELI